MRSSEPKAGVFLLLMGLVLTCADRIVAQSTPPPAELEAATIAAVPDESASFAASPSSISAEPSSVGIVPAPPPATTRGMPATHGIVYDDGWTLRPYDPRCTPFELKFSLHNQFRYTGFANRDPNYVNAAGQTIATPPRSDFDINRGWLIFSGYAIDPLVEFNTHIDYNTVSDRQVQVLLAWIRHPFSPALNVAYGLGKLPGTWEWQESSRGTLGAERSLATTFFRPSITAGIWAEGEVLPGVHYHTMIGNGFNTFTLNSSQLDTNFAYSGMLWWEPLGPFGVGFSDLEHHAEPVVRLGQAFTFSRQDTDPAGQPGPEQTVIRLSDGTPLVTPGALAPGATVNEFDLSLYAVHAGAKYRGFSLSGEYFFRWLTNLRADVPIPNNSFSDHGFFMQSGAFVVANSLEVFARGAAVFGPFGDGSEIAGGLNWYVRGNRSWRITTDVAAVDHSPAQQDRTGFTAGASGTLFRIQCWTSF